MSEKYKNVVCILTMYVFSFYDRLNTLTTYVQKCYYFYVRNSNVILNLILCNVHYDAVRLVI